MAFRVRAFEGIPSGVAGVGVGAYAGFLVDKIAEYIYWKYVPTKPATPIFALDDWIVLLAGLGISAVSKKWEFGLGWLLGHLIGSGWFR
ncbi:MAG: hypothetical protein QXX41_05755 [Nitrososphaerota archaeon]